MTLVTVAACPDYIVQVSDRRLTSIDGTIFSDEEGKAIYLEMPTGQFLLGYTGLARINHQAMSARLQEILMDTTKAAGFTPLGTMERTTEALTDIFRRGWIRYVPAEQRRLTLVITGYVAQVERPPTLVHGLITNFQDWGVDDSVQAWDAFSFTAFSTKPDDSWPTLIERIGQYEALRQDLAEAKLRPLLEQRRPAHAVRDSVLHLLPTQSSERPTIGGQANAAILRPGQQVEWSYHSAVATWKSYSGDTVIAYPDNIVSIRDMYIEKVGATGSPVHVPVVARRRPCPCRSGLRYGQCHGKRLRSKS